MLEKINPRYIFLDHIETLRITGKSTIYRGDIVLFLVLPIAIAALSVFLFGLTVGDGLAQALFTGLSIFAGLLFNLQILVYDIVNRENEKTAEDESRELKLITLNEVFSNISYAILIALITVIVVGFNDLTFGGGWIQSSLRRLCADTPFYCDTTIYKAAIDFFILTLTLNFIFTLLMVLRRVHFLLSSELLRASQK